MSDYEILSLMIMFLTPLTILLLELIKKTKK